MNYSRVAYTIIGACPTCKSFFAVLRCTHLSFAASCSLIPVHSFQHFEGTIIFCLQRILCHVPLEHYFISLIDVRFGFPSVVLFLTLARLLSKFCLVFPRSSSFYPMSAWRYSLWELVLLSPRLLLKDRALSKDCFRRSGDKVIHD